MYMSAHVSLNINWSLICLPLSFIAVMDFVQPSASTVNCVRPFIIRLDIPGCGTVMKDSYNDKNYVSMIGSKYILLTSNEKEQRDTIATA